MNKIINFLEELNPKEYCLYEVLSLKKINDELIIVLGCQESTTLSKRIYFSQVSSFMETFSNKGEDDISGFQLPQTMIGFDYWFIENLENYFEWELLGSEITWNFKANLPEVSNCKF